MNEVLYALGGLAVLVVVVGIVLHSKMDSVHAAALAPVSIAIVPAAPAAPAPPAPAPPAPPPAAVPVPLPPGGNTSDPVAPGFIPPTAAPAPEPAPAAPGWVPAPVMAYADCTGQNIPLNLGTTYTITDCPPSTMVGTNITSLPCDPYILVVNGVGTKKEGGGQCTVYVAGPTVTVSAALQSPPGVVNLILQVHAAA